MVRCWIICQLNHSWWFTIRVLSFFSSHFTSVFFFPLKNKLVEESKNFRVFFLSGCSELHVCKGRRGGKEERAAFSPPPPPKHQGRTFSLSRAVRHHHRRRRDLPFFARREERRKRRESERHLLLFLPSSASSEDKAKARRGRAWSSPSPSSSSLTTSWREPDALYGSVSLFQIPVVELPKRCNSAAAIEAAAPGVTTAAAYFLQLRGHFCFLLARTRKIRCLTSIRR